jgi:hypothetical protein
MALSWQELQQLFYTKLHQLAISDALALVERLSELAGGEAALGAPQPEDEQYQAGGGRGGRPGLRLIAAGAGCWVLGAGCWGSPCAGTAWQARF